MADPGGSFLSTGAFCPTLPVISARVLRRCAAKADADGF
jgi:hypothetical protein